QMKDERYISNQIELLKSYKIREIVADALIDSLDKREDVKDFQYLINRNALPRIEPISEDQLRKRLLGLVSIEQKKGLDAVTISSEGPYFREAQLITHTYASVYLEYNLELSREDVQNVKNYLNSEK